jgi:hypothetical protein
VLIRRNDGDIIIDGEAVTFEGTNTNFQEGYYEAGIYVENGISSIEISGINFESFNKNGIYINGQGSRIGNTQISGVRIFDTKGIVNNPTENCAGIKIKLCDQVSIAGCYIDLLENVYGQTDGIYLESTNAITINNNRINLDNRLSVSHVDCIQAFSCSTITIFKNYLKNFGESTEAGKEFTDRAGIILNNLAGEIKIHNNIITTRKTDNLINIHYYNYTGNIEIFNNTHTGLPG